MYLFDPKNLEDYYESTRSSKVKAATPRSWSAAAYGRWRLVSAQVVSCCVYEITKQ